MEIPSVNSLKDLETKLLDLKQRWPAHSVKPEMIEQFEKLEDEITRLKEVPNGNNGGDPNVSK